MTAGEWRETDWKDSIPRKSQNASLCNPNTPSHCPSKENNSWLFRTLHQETGNHIHKPSKEPPWERGTKGRDFEECSYIRGAPGVVYGSREENPPLPVNHHRLLVVGHRAFDGGRQHRHRRRAAQQGSRPPPHHGWLPAPSRWSKKKTAHTESVQACVRPWSSHTGLPPRQQLVLLLQTSPVFVAAFLGF